MGQLKAIKSRVERALTPAIVQLTRFAMKICMPTQLKRGFWCVANRNFLHYDTKIVARDMLGDKILCHTNDFVQKHILIFGIWEPTLTKYLLGKGYVDGIFLDIGANIGYFTLLASRRFAKVIAFEPSPSIYGDLADNIRINDLTNVVSHKVAIAAESGEIAFYKSAGSNIGTSSVVKRAGSVFESRVLCGPLETYIDPRDWPRVRFIKIDVEGSELDVVTSLLRVAHLLNRDVEILVETNGEHDEASVSIFKSLCDLGFKGYDLHSTYSLNDYLIRSPLAMTPVHEVPAAFTDCLFKYS